MDRIQLFGKIVKQLRFIYEFRPSSIFIRNCSTKENSNEILIDTKGLDNGVTRLDGIKECENNWVQRNNFASLLRNSQFIDLGDPIGKTVIGKIFQVVGDDLYIDFGWKFHCVCPKPKLNPDNYVRGSIVTIKIQDLELSTRFLGATTDLTLLEADCILLNIISCPLDK